MNRKGNVTPENFVCIVSSQDGGLWPLHLHLRGEGIDSRIGTRPGLGSTLHVPPEQREQAQDLHTAFLAEKEELHV